MSHTAHLCHCCSKPATSQCSSCEKEWYCSSVCQKVDWKKHKLICKILKKFSNYMQPFHEVVQVYEAIEASPASLSNRRIMEHQLLYLEYQFGNRIPSKMYRERSNGERMDNCIIEFGILMTASQRIVNLIILDTELSELQKDRMQMPYYEKMAEIGYFHLNLDESNQIYRLHKEQINHILDKLSSIELSKALIYTSRGRFDLAEIGCQRSLSYARRYEGGEKEKADLLCGAFKAYSNLRRSQDNYAEGVKFAEEAYNCVAEAYDPVHPHVQSAAGLLIELNIHMGNYFDAERFASLTLGSLKDPRNKINQVSDEVAKGYYNLGNVLMELKDLDKAEKLVRESLRIRVLLYGNNYSCTGHACGLLANILQLQGNLGDETEELYERALAICVVNEGSMGLNTSRRNADLSKFYKELLDTDLTPEKEKECVRLSTFYLKEYLRTSACKLGTAHP